jgi:hypothetical protein
MAYNSADHAITLRLFGTLVTYHRLGRASAAGNGLSCGFFSSLWNAAKSVAGGMAKIASGVAKVLLEATGAADGDDITVSTCCAGSLVWKCGRMLSPSTVMSTCQAQPPNPPHPRMRRHFRGT